MNLHEPALYYEQSLLNKLHCRSPKPLAPRHFQPAAVITTTVVHSPTFACLFLLILLRFIVVMTSTRPVMKCLRKFPLHSPNHPQVTMVTTHKYHSLHTTLRYATPRHTTTYHAQLRRVCQGGGVLAPHRSTVGKKAPGNSAMFLQPISRYHICLVAKTSVQMWSGCWVMKTTVQWRNMLL